MKHDRYLRYEELTAVLRELAERHPTRLRLDSLGKSWEGRDIWLCVVTHFETGPDVDKPAFWVDGNIHASELAPSSACLYFLDFLLEGYGTDPDIARCLDTRAFYVCPRLNPDGAEWALADSPRIIRSSTRPYPYPEEPAGELVKQDIDGDGRILTMRIPDPNGAWKIRPDEPRLMARREPTEVGGTYYRLLPEGRLEHYDGVTIRVRPDKAGLDLNRNFPAQWRQEHEQAGAGPYPASEPEVRSAVHFITHHPNITGGISFHTYSAVLLRPFSHLPDEQFPPEDLWTYQRLGKHGTELTGYPAISVFHDFRYHPKKVLTGAFDDWMYEHLGLFAWTVEIWDLRQQAGLKDYKYIEWYRDRPPEHDRELLRWSDQALGAQGYVAWYPFEHPELGPIELGGWDHLYTFRNPPPHLLEAEIARFPRWLLLHCLVSPRLELLEASAVPLGKGAYRVRVVVHNTGWLPTYVTRHAQEKRLVRGVVAEIELPPGAKLETGQLREELGQLEGRDQQPPGPNWWQADPTSDRLKVEWVIRAPEGGSVTVVARHARAGLVRTQLVLGD